MIGTRRSCPVSSLLFPSFPLSRLSRSKVCRIDTSSLSWLNFVAGGSRPESGILRTPQTMTRPIGHPELPPLPEEGEDRTLHDTDGIHSITTDDLVIA